MKKVIIIVTVVLAGFAVIGFLGILVSQSSSKDRDIRLSTMKSPIVIVGIAKEESNGEYVIKVVDGAGTFYTFYDNSLKSRKIGDVLR